jgi:hypothetical protein
MLKHVMEAITVVDLRALRPRSSGSAPTVRSILC